MNAGVWVPYIMFGDIEDVEMDSNVGLGARFGYNFGSESCVELGVTGSNMEASDIDAEATLIVAQLGYVHNFIIDGSNFVPFATLGSGWFSQDGDADDDGPILYGGGGTKYMFSDGFFGRLDLQVIQGYGESDSDLSFAVGLGVEWTFGGN
mgnify:CR=1 FL=1